MNKDKKGYLILADGTILEGRRFGAERDSIGELVFTTGVEGYVETLTDPSYCGQIVMQTFPLIGNYGMMEEDFEGKCALKGYVVREYCDTPSNFRSEYDLDTFLKNNDVPGNLGHRHPCADPENSGARRNERSHLLRDSGKLGCSKRIYNC